MRKDLFKIGEVAKLFNVSVSTLRHYEKLGIVIPEYVDNETGYRYYSTDQFEILNTLRYLRLLDTPLTEIEEFLNNRDIEGMIGMLTKQSLEIEKRINYLSDLKSKIKRRLEGIHEATEHPLEIVEDLVTSPGRMVWLKYGLMPDSNDDIERSIKMLEGIQKEPMIFIGKVGVGISREKLELREFDRYDEVFLLLDDEDAYIGEYTEMKQEKCLAIRFCGTHKDASMYYDVLINEMESRGLEPAGSSREVALIDWGLSKDPEDFVTKIEIPYKAK